VPLISLLLSTGMGLVLGPEVGWILLAASVVLSCYVYWPEIKEKYSESRSITTLFNREQQHAQPEEETIPRSNLSLFYDEASHRIHAAHDVVYYCVGLKNTKREAMDQISVRLRHIEPLEDKERLGKLITRLQGVPLMLRKDLEGQTELPKTDFFLYGKEETEVLILLETTAHGDTRVDIKHAVYEFGRGRTSLGDRARKPKFSEHVPHGRYLLTIEARGPDGSSDEKQFTFSVSPDTFSFQEVNS